MYPPIEPYAHGFLSRPDGQRVYWERCGRPGGVPAVVLHGGPGSGCTPWGRRLFDPARYDVVLFDQRGCGRSLPNAGDPAVSLAANTTNHLLLDIEALRAALGIERWVVVGGSWGSTLALAYARAHRERVRGMVLFGVTTGRRSEFDWTFRGGIGRLFPAEWERLLEALPAEERDGDVVEAFARRLEHSDAEVRAAAAYAWCLWESATPEWPPRAGLAPRFEDAAFRATFARVVTHYVRHNGWIEDGELLRAAGGLAGVPGVLVNGRFDLQAPLENAWLLHRAWPGSELVVVEDAGHAAGQPALTGAIVAATDRMAGMEGDG